MIFRKTLTFITFIMSLCVCATLTAQTAIVDSLCRVLATFEGSDYDKGLLLFDISYKYRTVDTALSRMYVMEALRLGQEKKLARLEGNAYFYLGNYYSYTGQYHIAHIYYKKAENVLSNEISRYKMCSVYQRLMLMFNDIDDRDNVVRYADKILDIAAEKYDLTTLTPLLYNASETDDEPVDFPSIIMEAQFLKGKALFKDNSDENALEYFLDMYQKSISMRVSVSILTQRIALECAEIYKNLNRPREALPYLHFVRENFELKQQSWNLPIIYYSLAETYAILKQTDSAEYYINKAGNSFLADDSKMTFYRTRSLIEANKGNYTGALESYKKYHHLSDSIANTGKTSEISRMKNWLELEQKDNEKKLLQQEYQKQRKLTIILEIAMVMILALFALSIFLYRKTKVQNDELKELHCVKDKLFSVVAHDLRSPIASLKSLMELVNEHKLDSDMQAQLMKDMTSRIDGIFGLLDNLLRWAKSQMQGIIPSPVFFDAQEASRVVTDAMKSVAESKEIMLNNLIEKQQLYADRDMFDMLIRNLTMNAIKYTSNNGEVTLASELKDNMMIISVKDTGTGMSQEIQSQLFKLSKTKSQCGTNNERGTGLGLVLCIDFVKASGGNIWFTSKQGEGSTFFFSLPKKELS